MKKKLSERGRNRIKDICVFMKCDKVVNIVVEKTNWSAVINTPTLLEVPWEFPLSKSKFLFVVPLVMGVLGWQNIELVFPPLCGFSVPWPQVVQWLLRSSWSHSFHCPYKISHVSGRSCWEFDFKGKTSGHCQIKHHLSIEFSRTFYITFFMIKISEFWETKKLWLTSKI